LIIYTHRLTPKREYVNAWKQEKREKERVEALKASGEWDSLAEGTTQVDPKEQAHSWKHLMDKSTFEQVKRELSERELSEGAPQAFTVDEESNKNMMSVDEQDEEVELGSELQSLVDEGRDIHVDADGMPVEHVSWADFRGFVNGGNGDLGRVYREFEEGTDVETHAHTHTRTDDARGKPGDTHTYTADEGAEEEDALNTQVELEEASEATDGGESAGNWLYAQRWARIMGPPLTRGKHVCVDLCTPDGVLERRFIGKSQGWCSEV
jgi:hypothetical protein